MRALILALMTGAMAQSWSPTNTPSGTPLPCPVRRFPNYDIIGTVLNKTFVADDATCMLQCCNLADLCVGYSFQSGLVGVGISLTSGVAITDSAFGSNTGIPCGAGEIHLGGSGNNFEGCDEWSGGTKWGYYSKLRSAILSGSGTVTAAPCILLSNITQLMPSNGWTGGIKLSAINGS